MPRTYLWYIFARPMCWVYTLLRCTICLSCHVCDDLCQLSCALLCFHSRVVGACPVTTCRLHCGDENNNNQVLTPARCRKKDLRWEWIRLLILKSLRLARCSCTTFLHTNPTATFNHMISPFSLSPQSSPYFMESSSESCSPICLND